MSNLELILPLLKKLLLASLLILAATFVNEFIYVLLQHTQYIPTITNYTQLWWVPNVVVAHEKEGIEAVHLASGRTLCKVKTEMQKT